MTPRPRYLGVLQDLQDRERARRAVNHVWFLCGLAFGGALAIVLWAVVPW